MMHMWGSDFKYFEDVSHAADYIGDFCVFWGRINVHQTKEKYETVRVYCGSLGTIENLYWFFRPNYVYYQWPRWFRTIDDKIFGNFFWVFHKPIYYWQKIIYRVAYKRAIKKWPHIREEILSCADYDELLKGL